MAQQFAGTAQLQILACDLETVAEFENDLEPCAGELRQGIFVQQYAYRLAAAAPHASAQLVQLGQAHAFGVLDHHQRGIGHVDADLDHRGGDEKVQFVRLEGRHHRLLLVRFQAAVHQTHTQFGKLFRERRERVLRGLQLQFLGFLDQRTHPVGLATGEAGVAHACEHVVAARRTDQLGHHRSASRWQRVDGRDVEVGVETHRQRARNRRRTHHQLVRLVALFR